MFSRKAKEAIQYTICVIGLCGLVAFVAHERAPVVKEPAAKAIQFASPEELKQD